MSLLPPAPLSKLLLMLLLSLLLSTTAPTTTITTTTTAENLTPTQKIEAGLASVKNLIGIKHHPRVVLRKDVDAAKRFWMQPLRVPETRPKNGDTYQYQHRAFVTAALSWLTQEIPVDMFYSCNHRVLCYVATASKNGKQLNVDDRFPGLLNSKQVASAYVTSSISGDLDYEHYLPSLGGIRRGGVDVNAVLFMENAAKLWDGGPEEYARELESKSWWSLVNVGMGYSKSPPAKMIDFGEKQQQQQQQQISPRWRQMSYVLSSNPLAFQHAPLSFTMKIPAIAWFSSQCLLKYAGQRIRLVDQFLAAVRSLNQRVNNHDSNSANQGIVFHSYGKCGHNAEPEDVAQCLHIQASLDSEVERMSPEVRRSFRTTAYFVHHSPVKLCILRHHRFVLAYENSEAEGYVTEKLFQALKSGSVPIYWGDPSVIDILPHPDAIVDARKFATAFDLATYVERAMHDENVYERHTAWKKMDPMDWQPGFYELLQRSKEILMCNVCEQAVEVAALSSSFEVLNGSGGGGGDVRNEQDSL